MFFPKKKHITDTYDKENQIPVIRASICTGEQVAGFKDIHLGKIPKGEKDKLNKLKRITSLENKLKKAIEMEEYELAAILRDKIKIIKGEFYNNEKLDV